MVQEKKEQENFFDEANIFDSTRYAYIWFPI